MDMNFEQKVRERAYQIWMSAGMADGQAHEHWVIAEQAVTKEAGGPATKVAPVKKAAAAKTAAPKKAPAKKTPAKPAAPKANAKTSKAKH